MDTDPLPLLLEGSLIPLSARAILNTVSLCLRRCCRVGVGV